MQFTLLDDFKYMQFYSQAYGGWCGGVSEAALAYVAETLDSPYRPAEVMSCLRDFVRMASFGYNRITNSVSSGTPGLFRTMRENVFRRQDKYEMGGPGTPGSWVTDFSGNGWAYLRLYVGDRNPEITHGSQWATGWFDGTVNHAGFVVWFGNEVCLFDPNVGGIHYTFTPNVSVQDFTQAMDMALDLMYHKNDRMKGERLCNVVSAKRTPGAPA